MTIRTIIGERKTMICWCGGEVGPREPGDANGLGCLENIHHVWGFQQTSEGEWLGQIPPDWEWTDAFGDTMQFNRAGENVVLTVVRRRDGDDYDHACVSLNPAQQRALRAALFGIGMKRREQTSDLT